MSHSSNPTSHLQCISREGCNTPVTCQEAGCCQRLNRAQVPSASGSPAVEATNKAPLASNEYLGLDRDELRKIIGERDTEIERLRAALDRVRDADSTQETFRIAVEALSGDSSAPETSGRSCGCIPLAPRSGKYCQDCGGLIAQPGSYWYCPDCGKPHPQPRCNQSPVETSAPLTPAEMGTVARMAAVSAQVQPEKASDNCPTGDYPCEPAKQTTTTGTPAGHCIYCGRTVNGKGDGHD